MLTLHRLTGFFAPVAPDTHRLVRGSSVGCPLYAVSVAGAAALASAVFFSISAIRSLWSRSYLSASTRQYPRLALIPYFST